jgi:integrase
MTVAIRYLWNRSPTGPFWFKRKVPKDLVDRVGKTWLQFSLGTRDVKTAARLITRHSTEQDKLWANLRDQGPVGTIAQGKQLLESFGIDPMAPKDSREGARWAFEDLLDEHLPDHLRESGSASQEELQEHLPPAHYAALQMYQGQHLASDCQREYAESQSGGAKAAKAANLPFKYLIDLCGDKPLGEYRRKDVRKFVTHLTSGGHSLKGRKIAATTVKRYINTLRAAFTRSIREHELGIDNVWAGIITYPKDAKGETKRPSFTVDDYRTLHTAIGDIDQTDDRRCILALIAETGARLAEIVGLRIADCHPHAAVPYLHIQEYDLRTVKTDYSDRKVPLTPRGLQTLQRALALSTDDTYLFPRYTSDKGCKATHASNTLNDWLRSRVGQGLTNHSMRHGMEDLLRAVECPSEIADRIIGHQTPGMGAKYGKGYPLSLLTQWVNKATKEIT